MNYFEEKKIRYIFYIILFRSVRIGTVLPIRMKSGRTNVSTLKSRSLSPQIQTGRPCTGTTSTWPRTGRVGRVASLTSKVTVTSKYYYLEQFEIMKNFGVIYLIYYMYIGTLNKDATIFHLL